MTIKREVTDDGIAVVTMHHPPVNAITVGDTWAIRDAFAELAETPNVRAAILTAEGKGFNAGIDIKEMQSAEGFEHLLGSGAACYAAFDDFITRLAHDRDEVAAGMSALLDQPASNAVPAVRGGADDVDGLTTAANELLARVRNAVACPTSAASE